MIRFFITSLLLFCSIIISAQPNTEIFLFDTSYETGELKFENSKNISNNEGYDNQPSFLNDNVILFSSTRNGQTDIVQYRDNYGTKSWLNFTEGGEYTPLKIPNKKAVSAVRLDKDGKQRLYSYSLRNGASTELINDLVVAYYTWYNEDIIVSAVIEDNNLNLYTSNLKEGWNRKYETKVGRSFHKNPNSNLVSYISKQDSINWKIKSLNPLTGETKVIANTISGVEDICWLINGTILSGKDSKLYQYNTKTNEGWQEVGDLSAIGIKKITRIASNAISSKLLIAAEIESAATNTDSSENTDDTTNSQTTNNTVSDAGAIVQKHIEPYNRGDLDAFANAFVEDVVVSRFPNRTISKGRQDMKDSYQEFFNNNTNLTVRVTNRIVLKNMVIDEEIATVNERNQRQVTIYSTSNNGIETMTFISNSKTTTNPEIIVDKQLEAYNKRDIDAFMATYSSDVKLYNYPDKLSDQGQESMRKGYKSWFDRHKDLKAMIKKRLVIGNKVIDFEEVTASGQRFEAVAIYETENGLIKKVTFIQ